MTAETFNSSQHQPRFDASEVGWLFVQEYYTFMNRQPDRLHCFYTKKSTYVSGNEGEQSKVCHGQQEIHHRINELYYENCKVLVSNVDTQASLDGGIIVQVLGEMTNKNQASQKFCQTFFLAQQENGFYVLNDIFRFLKENIEEIYEETPDIAHEKIDQEQFIPPVSGSDVSAFEIRNLPDSANQHANEPSISSELATKSAAVVQDSSSLQQIPMVPTKSTSASVNKTDVSSTSQSSASGQLKPYSRSKDVGISRSDSGRQATLPPNRPKTWANLAATKFPDAPSPSQSQAMSNGSPQSKNQNSGNPALKNSEQGKKGTSESTPDAESKPVTNKKSDARKHSDSLQKPNDEKERFSVYIKGLVEGTTEKMIRDVFSKIGPVRNVDLLPNRNIAFVEYEKIESATKAIGQKFVVNGSAVLAEERRKNRNSASNGRSNLIKKDSVKVTRKDGVSANSRSRT